MQTTVGMIRTKRNEVAEMVEQLDAVTSEALIIMAETMVADKATGATAEEYYRKAVEKAVDYLRSQPGYEREAQAMLDTLKKWEQEHNI